jgi:DNA-binding CsgD family transcriptional regulator
VTGHTRSVQETIRACRWLLDVMLTPFPNGSINVFDRDLRYLYAAGAGLEQVGLSADMLIDQRLDELFPPELVEPIRRFYARAFAGETVTFTLVAFGLEYDIRAAPIVEPDGEVNAIVAMAQETPVRPRAEVLSPELREIASLIADGLNNEQIAGRLCVATSTVRHRVDQIMNQLRFVRRTQIGVWAVASRLYEVEGGPDRADSH